MKVFTENEKKIIDKNAKIIWDYMKMNHSFKKMDAIFILGSNDIRVADRAAELYQNKFASVIICSGGNGKDSSFLKTEAEVFSERLIYLGIPKSHIILESRATNTGENILYTKKIILEKNLDIKSFILVQKPYMERRTYASFKKQWPEPEIIVTSPQISFEDYSNENEEFKYKWIEVMVGDLQRIIEYPKRGFQIKQEVPKCVFEAWKNLVDIGFTKYFLK